MFHNPLKSIASYTEIQVIMAYHLIEAPSDWVDAVWCCPPKRITWVPTWDGKDEPPYFPPLKLNQMPPLSDPTDWRAIYGLPLNMEPRQLPPPTLMRYQMEAGIASSQPPTPRRRGPRPKPLHERPLKLVVPKRHHFTHTRERRLQVTSYICNRDTWVFDRSNYPVREGLQKDGYWRPLNNNEVQNIINIPSSAIRRWWVNRDRILNHQKTPESAGPSGTAALQVFEVVVPQSSVLDVFRN